MEQPSPLSFADAVPLEQPGQLASSKDALMERWKNGERDPDTAMGLAFLEWWSCSEPDFLTGLRPVAEMGSREESVFSAIFDFLVDANSSQEILFVFGWMCEQFPYCCCGTEVRDWKRLGTDLRRRYNLGANLPKNHFSESSTFGSLFRAHPGHALAATNRSGSRSNLPRTESSFSL